MTQENEKILARVKKMITLGNDAGATEAERETALRMAYNAMAKHNLTMADLPDDDAGKENRERQSVTISADKWARTVAQQVSKLFFCKYYFTKTCTAGKDNHVFVGLQSNVATSIHMTEYLVKSIKKEAGSRYKSPTTPDGRSFCVGAAYSIYLRVIEMLKTDTESSPGTSLVLVRMHEREEEENHTWLVAQGTFVKPAQKRADNSIRSGAYYDGRDYGTTVSLNKQIK